MVHTVQSEWLSLGTIDATAAAADAALGVAERDYAGANALDNVVSKILPISWNVVEARFLLVANGSNVTIDVWGGRSKKSTIDTRVAEMARICTLDVECGLQQTDNGSLLYADEIIITNITNNDWLKTVYAVQSANDSDLMARLILDMCGYDLLLFHGHTAFPEDCIIEIAGF
jgi:hypothetical protein